MLSAPQGPVGLGEEMSCDALAQTNQLKGPFAFSAEPRIRENKQINKQGAVFHIPNTNVALIEYKP